MAAPGRTAWNPLGPTLLAFNDRVSLIDMPIAGSGVEGPACDWDLTAIYAFLDRVVNNMDHYGVPAANQGFLANVVQDIKDLSLPTGAQYVNVALVPNQHIYRAINPAWPAAPGTPLVSKFAVVERIYNQEKFWSCYDLLALLLSLMGPAPNGAAFQNFFFALIFVYSKWCRKIAGRTAIGDPRGVGDQPAMVQCTWTDAGGATPTYFIGASLAGYAWNDATVVGKWKESLQFARYSVLGPDVTGYPFPESVLPTSLFGNCAETYPFAHFNRAQDTYPLDSLCGFAVQPDRLNGAAKQFENRLQKYLIGPCDNCAHILGRLGAQLQSFDWRDIVASARVTWP